METKVCSRCNIEKPIEQFYSNSNYRFSKDGSIGTCNTCRKKRQREADKTREDCFDRLRRYIKSRPCLDCRKQYPPHVMQFHHSARASKKMGLGQVNTLRAFVEELEKCIVLCANCHARRELSPNSIMDTTKYAIWLLKKDSPCQDCNIAYDARIMHFHHPDPDNKEVQVSRAKNKKAALLEIEKCVLLCPNCHMEREWGQHGLSKTKWDSIRTKIKASTKITAP